ncbi:MAG TPA: hypothetical protein PLV95_01605 [Candidatus Pacearchaeota archaeon]|nr:hypothetical protein [Candidatus Pacearchaeota archaeon]
MNDWEIVSWFLGLRDYMPLAQILFEKFEEVELIESPQEPSFGKDNEEIEKRWKEHLKACPNDFDGCLGSVVSFSLSEKKLSIKFRKARFSEYYFAQRPEMLNIADCNNYCLPLSFGAIAITKPTEDCPFGSIIFAERGKTAFDSGKITLLPGGYFDPEQDYFGGEKGEKIYSLNITILRECFEELCFHTLALKIDFLGVIYNRRQPLIAVLLNLPFTAEQLKESVNSGKETEVERVFFIDNNIYAVREFLTKEARQGKKLAIHDAWKLILYFSDTNN